MKSKQIRLIALLMILSGTLALRLGMQKSVILKVNGETHYLSTYAFTVGGLLHQAGITTGEKDFVYPLPGNWLRHGITVTIEQSAQISIWSDKRGYFIQSAERIPANLLAQAEIPLYPGDRLVADGLPIAPDELLPRARSHSLQVIRAVPVRLNIDSLNHTLITSASSTGKALWEAGIRLFAMDAVKPGLEAPITRSLEIVIHSSRKLAVQFETGEAISRSAASTVGTALAQVGLSLQGLDYSDPSPTTAIPSSGIIQITHVHESISLETEPLPFETQTQLLQDLEIDTTRVIQAGAFGLAARRIRTRFEDGLEVSRQVEGKYIAKDPQARIVGYGTRIEPKVVQTPKGNITYWRALNMYAVSYNPSSAGGSITASGLPLAKGVVAIDPTYISLGTRLFIPGYGEAIAADTGGGVRGRIIDLGYSDSDYVSWHQWVTVYFLWPPPETVTWIVP